MASQVLLEAGPGAGPQSELLAALEAITREGQCLPLALVEGTLLARPSEGPARTEQVRLPRRRYVAVGV